ncbi:MAG: hypothetical protein ACYSWZ_00960 [Planctomycetota bacterium]
MGIDTSHFSCEKLLGYLQNYNSSAGEMVCKTEFFLLVGTFGTLMNSSCILLVSYAAVFTVFGEQDTVSG